MEYDIITWENINEAIEIIAKQIEDTKFITKFFTDLQEAD